MAMARFDNHVVVTGCAGFLGSHLCERLVERGRDVVGIDSFSDYYSRPLKEANLERLREEPRFALVEMDISREPVDSLLDGALAVFHLAAQAGVRGSFGDTFQTYLRDNVLATQRLLEAAARQRPARFVYASSSSVYGDTPVHPTPESAECRPVSPYGMTKVATETLAAVYHRTHGVPAVGLRFFTVYGPRQRPDMAFSRFLDAALSGDYVPILGDGRQVRDFTFVDDIVAGTLAAAEYGRPGAVYNLGGGSPVELLDVVDLVEEILGRPVDVRHMPAPVGEPRVTAADITLAARDLGFAPATTLPEGVAAQLEWKLDHAPVRVRRFQRAEAGAAVPVHIDARDGRRA